MTLDLQMRRDAEEGSQKLSLQAPWDVHLWTLKKYIPRVSSLKIELGVKNIVLVYRVFHRRSKGFQPVTRQHIPSLYMYVCLSSEPQALIHSDKNFFS